MKEHQITLFQRVLNCSFSDLNLNTFPGAKLR